MKKSLLIAPRQAARTVLPGPDADRLLAGGSWVQVVKPKPRTREAKAMNQLRERQREKGFRNFRVVVPGELFEALHAAKHENENFAQLLARLVHYVSTEST
ncbi:hypothetical protein [Pseudogulbenkiania sp. MAI-1]|uniref:hypothetical protein n=1 Tax=Pseudogulbenkiania sp. MAI-1 TaxID=990370 RepID=UPI0009FD5931|nr:hypothetical protein [Pseudogulbenkiania sp. MAI-1]